MLRLFIACLATLLVSSCLDSHEEVWINADASGKAQVRIALPLHIANANGGEQELKALITDYFESTPAFTSYSVATSVAGDQMVIDLHMTFDNAFDLKDLSTNPVYEQLPDAADDLLGITKVEIDGTKLNFLRTIDLTQAIPGSVLIPKDQLKGHKLTTIIHLPIAASSHNADFSDKSGKTLIWTTPLATALRKPVNQVFTMEIPMPWFSISLITAGVLLIAGTVVFYLRRRLKRMA